MSSSATLTSVIGAFFQSAIDEKKKDALPPVPILALHSLASQTSKPFTSNADQAAERQLVADIAAQRLVDQVRQMIEEAFEDPNAYSPPEFNIELRAAYKALWRNAKSTGFSAAVNRIVRQVNDQVVSKKLDETRVEQKRSDPVIVGYKNTLTELPVGSRFCIGRYTSGGHLTFPRLSNSSRLHAMIFVLPNTIVVADLGSATGIRTLSRSSKNYTELHHSKSVYWLPEMVEERRALLFERCETFELEMGSERVVFNPVQ